MSAIVPNWNIFKTKFNDNLTYCFEYFCYLLFCIEFDKPQGIFRYKNQAGIEWDPIEVAGKTIVAQCKFYDTSLGSNKDEILKMLDTIKRKYKTPCELKFYTNQDWGQGKNQGINNSKPKIEIEKKAQEYCITIDWRTNESYFLSPDVAFNQDLMKHFFTDSSIYDLVYNKQIHTQNILKDIRTDIDFKSQKIEIDRSGEINQIQKELENYQALIISGIGGVGKTAIVKKLYEKIENDAPLYLFKASEFETNQIDNLFGIYSLQKFMDVHTHYDTKVVVIDSAEKILDLNNADPFKEFISTLLDNQWKILFTTRYAYLDDLKYHLQQNLQIIPYRVDIQNLSMEILSSLSQEYHFALPQDEKLLELLKNPFELKDYLSLNAGDVIDYQTFKTNVWNQNIKKSNPQRELCFVKLVSARANEGQFYVNIECSTNVLEELLKDGILGYEIAGYFITHDKYEEWGLAYIIEREFIKRKDVNSFFEQIGSSLPIRRAFRNWVSEKLLLNDETIESFIEYVIDNGEIESFWKDEVFVSVLLSEYSQTFFENYDTELKANDYKLLKRIAFLLQIACKEVDDSIWKQAGIHNIHAMKDVKYIFTKPIGSGWISFIRYIWKNIDTLQLQHINTILPVLSDWNGNVKSGDTTQAASLIALKYYNLIYSEEYKYSLKDNISTICKVIINGSNEIQEELKDIFDEIIKNKWKSHSDKYYELSKIILTKIDGWSISKKLTKEILELGNLFWTKTSKKVENNGMFPHYEREEVEDAFSLTNEYEIKYFPSSAYQTPILNLLRHDFKNTVYFILNFINQSVENYAKSGWENRFHDSSVFEVDLYIDNEVYIQYHSQALWNIYRGTSSPVSPYLLQSIHMALEKHLLEIAPLIDSKTLEMWLIYLLKNSKSSSISAIVASIVLANQEKTFNVAAILFKTKEFIRADLIRHMKDSYEVKSLNSMGYGLNVWHQFYQNERLKTCEDKHRNSHLERLFLNYQLFRTKEINEEESEKRQKILWEILNNYYDELLPENEQSEKDKTWRMFLSRMDRRNMEIETQEVENGIQMIFNPQMPQELKNYQEKAQKESLEATKYTSLYLWATNKIENDPKYKEYEKYEENPLFALEELKKVIEIPYDKRDFIFQDEIFPSVSVLLLRDSREVLSREDIELCKDIIMEFATSPFIDDYRYQSSDGVKTAISFLPILIDIFPKIKDEIKTLLLLHLFTDYQIGHSGTYFYDFAIHAIQNYYDEENIKSFVLGYLLFKPKYATEVEKIFYETYEHRYQNIDEQKRLEDFMKENEADIEKFITNQLTMEDIPQIADFQLFILNVAFKLIPVTSNDIDYKNIIKEFIKNFSIKLLNERRNDKLKHEVKLAFIKRLALYILHSNQNDTKECLQPLLDNFVISEDIANLLTQLILIENQTKHYENFWYIWSLFEKDIILLCKNGDYCSDIKQIIQVYLMAFSPYGEIWTDKAKKWHTLKPQDKRFFKHMAKEIGHCPSTLYSISKILTSVGSSYLNDGVGWIANMLRGNKNLWSDSLETNTIYHIETLMRKYIFENSQKIKHEIKTKKDAIEILTFMVEKGSALGYMLRERIL